MVKRIFVEKKEGFETEAGQLRRILSDYLGDKVFRILWRYDVEGLNEDEFKLFAETFLSGGECENIFYGSLPPEKRGKRSFEVEYLRGQYDQRADSAEQCAQLIIGKRPRVKTAKVYIIDGPISDDDLNNIKNYLINPVDSSDASAEAGEEIPLSLEYEKADPPEIPIITGFKNLNTSKLEECANLYGLSMSIDDLQLCRDYFKTENRDPTLTELRVLDTYWSDHCRHTTFFTILEDIEIENDPKIKEALELYEEKRREVYGKEADKRPKSLMDMATLAGKVLKKKGLLSDLDESPEVNACTVRIEAEFQDDDKIITEPWLLYFKNETHNHPTEIEPFGGAATCLGGGIRDPLSGRAIVHQAMRITGAGDPRVGLSRTIPGKLPQIKIAREAAEGYSSYGNQVGVPGGQVAEFYHPGFLAKRMELGALVGAVPESWVRREEPAEGDVVILAGGRTGRDGIGGATSSSNVQSVESYKSASAEVQKGNAIEERKILRLFRRKEVCRLIKRCNDFGAGGVSVAVGELAAGLDINLDTVPLKYGGLSGTEIALSESQERMAIVCSSKDVPAFMKACDEEGLEATVIANVTSDDYENARMCMYSGGEKIVDLSRKFLSTNGAVRRARASIVNRTVNQGAPASGPAQACEKMEDLIKELSSLRSASRKNLVELFDSTGGAGTVLFPQGGSTRGTPECGMAALLPTVELSSINKKPLTASLMTFGYDPVTMSTCPYIGAKGSIREALAKIACLGGDPFKTRLSMQEYFQRPDSPESRGLPVAALLGALEAQLHLGIPAIGGKDSMSGNYLDKERDIDIKVPPSLLAFAVGIVRAEKVRSGTLSGESGNTIILLAQTRTDEWESFKANMKTLTDLEACRALKAAYPLGAGGVAGTLAIMAFGNMTGVKAFPDSFNVVDPLFYQGSVLAEIDESALPGDFKKTWIKAGTTIKEEVFRIESPEPEVTPLAMLRKAYEHPLAQVYPQDYDRVFEQPKIEVYKGKKNSVSKAQGARPLVVLPIFPGTNGELDMERAFLEAGAKTKQIVFRNRDSGEIEESIKEMANAFKEAQIIAFSGGFCHGDELGSPGKFIASVIRKESIAKEIIDLLDNRSGLILGISSGFHALIQSGLIPHGRILEKGEDAPVFTTNLGHSHISRMIRTLVMPNISPWLSLDETGSIHIIPVSHSQGRLVIGEEQGKALFASGQVPFCYADTNGKPSMKGLDNPGGSAFAIEGITSPDGRVLGKMGHSERRGDFVHINIPGNKKQNIFEAGVNFFK
ncbi:MAG: phosphoribosylformylglycinamidine synthase [Treponema sp.]|nr:phosphoribosylformylglycinamidine synthase [Treponema sp.]